MDVCVSELQSVARDGLTRAELERAKGQVKGSMVLGQEDPGSRMSRIAKSELSGEPLDDMSRVLDRVEAVTCDDVHAVASDLFTQNFTVRIGQGNSCLVKINTLSTKIQQ